MAYAKKLWGSGDYLTTEELNRIEDGVANYNGTTGAARIAAGRASFPSHASANLDQSVTVNFPAGTNFTEIPYVNATWSARGIGGAVSRLQNPYISNTTTTGFTVSWYTDGVSLGEHHFDWIAVGV